MLTLAIAIAAFAAGWIVRGALDDMGAELVADQTPDLDAPIRSRVGLEAVKRENARRYAAVRAAVDAQRQAAPEVRR